MNIGILVETYGFRSVFSPELAIMAMLAIVFYWRYKGDGVSRRGSISFIAGTFLLYFALGGPLNVLGHFYFSMHMLQQSILYLIVPPLIFSGLPRSFYELVVKYKIGRGIVAVFGQPLVAMFLFNGTFSFYHIPLIFEATMSNYALHKVVHIFLILTAFGLWWSVFTPVGKQIISPIKKIGYIFLNGLMLTPACALIIFAREPLYAIYTGETRLLCLPFYSMTVDQPAFESKWLTQLGDQQLGGVIMKIMQEIAYGTVLGLIFFKWYRSEKADDPDNPLLPSAS
ncbi:cytochrome c oxidase assembly protein [Paenibacillus puerhi]|uniref:cytochrome c oxidase assembly protein n=1 Tax=Paenibacillus puerhi TaxID=2692622 RepID=UPI001F30EDFC|nr:cytochrome c oxidase assembly protein [Paenibacillus puerhi]